jgi:hypothetical protein
MAKRGRSWTSIGSCFYSPNPEHAPYYREAMARQEEIYAAVVNPVR